MGSAKRDLKDLLPKGWWRSPRWWFEDWRGGVRLMAMMLAPVALVGCAVHAVRHRDKPERLASQDLTDWGSSALLYVAGIGFVVWAAVKGYWDVAEMSPVAVGLWLAWLAVNAAVPLMVCAVQVRSRARDRVAWGRLDYIQRHAPVVDRPPETVEEYDALRMRSSM